MGAWIEIKTSLKNVIDWFSSHPTMGAWIEIFNNSSEHLGVNVSHPTMGAWIEIWCSHKILTDCYSRTPRWVRGLKSFEVNTLQYAYCRTPRWVRGLKFPFSSVGIK